MNDIAPCVWFDDRSEEAAAVYAGLLPDSRITGTSRYPESFDNPAGRPPGSVLTVEMELAGRPFTALNGGPAFTLNPSISFFVHTDARDDTDRLFSALAEGGTVMMPLQEYPWSERYGWVQDRFGVSWQVMQGSRHDGRDTVVPCLMFTGDRHGRAEEAIGFYTGVFDDARVRDLSRYEADEGTEGTIKHGRFVLAGHDFVAMDSHGDHGFGFNEALSLQVLCDDQAAVDRHWEALSDGGEEGPCGWLKDRFGVSWQVVPRVFVELMKRDDAAAAERMFRSMLDMKKLDVATLRSAYEE